jgi:hypothetical protein
MEKDCPQNCLPKLENLNEMTKNWKEVLDSVILEIMSINTVHILFRKKEPQICFYFLNINFAL